MGYYLINVCFGGFGWSEEAEKEIRRRRELLQQTQDNNDNNYDYDYDYDYNYEYDRTCSVAHHLFDEWGSKRCSGRHSNLCKEKVPDELMEYVIVHEYDGLESINVDTTKFYETMMEDLLGTTGNCTMKDVMACRKEILRIQELWYNCYDNNNNNNSKTTVASIDIEQDGHVGNENYDAALGVVDDVINRGYDESNTYEEEDNMLMSGETSAKRRKSNDDDEAEPDSSKNMNSRYHIAPKMLVVRNGDDDDDDDDDGVIDSNAWLGKYQTSMYPQYMVSGTRKRNRY